MKLVKEGSNPFQKSGRTVRSPESEKRSSLVDTRRESYPPSNNNHESNRPTQDHSSQANGDIKKTNEERKIPTHEEKMKGHTSETENEELRSKLREIELLCKELKKEIDELRAENEPLKQTKNKEYQPELPKSTEIKEYWTDEEELVREMEWIVKRKTKNRVLSRRSETQNGGG